ncbi:aspartate carbamoyltransferase [Candidatus Uhrbacteria bacterium]|nr:aspartate carbamoyltransferase [Candidatus Uhrbacteria bacterium]
MKHCHIVSAEQFKREHLEEIFGAADAARYAVERNGGTETLARKLVSVIFYQPSTRTAETFKAAALRHGARVSYNPDAKIFSSAAKGESLEHTIRVLGGEYMADLIVLRHPNDDAAERAAGIDMAPIINAGSGTKQHPTQALVDMYTIKNELGRLENLHVVMAGDPMYGRTIRSLACLLALYPGNRITFVSPPDVCIGDDIKLYLRKLGTPFEETDDMDSVLGQADVWYHTRVQEEWYKATGQMELYERIRLRYVMTPEHVAKMKPEARLMHPMPINGEIATALDDHPQVIYFKQATRYAVPIRMGLLTLMLTPGYTPPWGWRKP